MIATYGFPYSMRPFVIGIAGAGNVSKGSQEILDLLPVKEVNPAELPDLNKRKDSGNFIYKVIFNEWDIVEPVEEGKDFDLQEYYDHPERYRSNFARYIPYLSVLMNCIYWEPRYPRLLKKDQIKELYQDHRSPKLRIIGDISCDIDGAIEATVKATSPEDPIYVYDPWEDSVIPGWKGTGPVILPVDNLPCEIPKESSEYFGDKLKEFLPQLANLDLSLSFEELNLPKPIREATILYKGKITEKYDYMKEFVKES
jgi:alpha-aminoadipic semialdehyde synthase